MWLCFIISYIAGPYVNSEGPYRFNDPSNIFSVVNKIFLLYFIGCILINNQKKLKWLVLTIIFSLIYLIYWTNDQYLSQMQFGRIGGPKGIYSSSIYSDENTFAMLFVIGLPFLFYIGLYLKKIWLRWALWLAIPFGWHAIFLTGSRGGLVGLGVTIVLGALRSPKKLIGVMLIPAFILAYIWQAGDLMKSRTQTISEYKTEESAATRLEAWSAAMNMVSKYPISGVGLASFGPAFPDHSDKEPRVAHNTFFQISAESGIIAGIMYILITISIITGLWKNGIRYRNEHASSQMNHLLFYLNEATLVGFCGIVVCSVFLSLQVYEVFYFLCLISNTILYLSNKEFKSAD
jgi:probable O-glycosylation ligase (exosortase A-associated)